MWIIYITQLILIIMCIINIISDFLFLVPYLLDDSHTFLLLSSAMFYLGNILGEYINTFAYISMVIGVIIAATERARFRGALFRIALSGVLLLIANAINLMTSVSMTDFTELIGNAFIIVLSVSVMDCISSLAEDLNEKEVFQYSEKHIRVNIIIFLVAIIFDICSLIFTNSESYLTTFLAVDIISETLRMVAFIVSLKVFRQSLIILRRARKAQITAGTTVEAT